MFTGLIFRPVEFPICLHNICPWTRMSYAFNYSCSTHIMFAHYIGWLPSYDGPILSIYS